MDWSWMGQIENPIALFAVIVFLFIGAVVLIWRLSAKQNENLVLKFLDRADKQNEKLVEVVEKNTEGFTKLTTSNLAIERAVHRLSDIVETKLEVKE